jgi:type I restriction enzyme, S subunit
MNKVELDLIARHLRNGTSIKQDNNAAGTPITRIETIADWNINPERFGYADVHHNDYPQHLMQKGDILISHINSTKHLGKCALYRGHPEKLIHGMNLLSLRVDKVIACPSYVYHMLCSSDFRRQLPRITKDSVNQSSFNITNFKQLKIPLPPIEEQKRIAAILDKADEIRKKCEKAKEAYTNLLSSLAQRAFRGEL